MMGRILQGWWWRLQLLQWVHAAKAQPLRRTTTLLAWWLPWVLIPVALNIAGPSSAEAGLSFLLSLDVPLTLMLAAATVLETLGIESRARAEGWLWPPAFRPAGLRWISRLRWLLAARWPAGLALAGLLLACGTHAEPDAIAELMLMALFGIAAGAILVWTLRTRSTAAKRTSAGFLPGRGMSTLSWVAFNEARTHFDLRRGLLLAIPCLLAVPLGALASDAARMLAVWLPMLFVLIACREAGRIQQSLRQWLRATPRMQLRLVWSVWRFIALGIAVTAALYVLWPAAHASGRAR
jgi:hypothetical protein